VAAQLGYCGLDRKRAPLVGDEIRPCWEAATSVPVVQEVVPITTSTARPVARATPPPTEDAPAALDFVEVGTPPSTDETAPAATASVATDVGQEPDPAAPEDLVLPTQVAAAGPEPGWSFWAELEG
jgi:hypothetical protein